MEADARIWRLSACARLHWLVFEENHILFNAASGQTHILNELGAAIVHLLENAALTPAEVSRQLVAQYAELSLTPELHAAIDGLLVELDTLGLIEPGSM